MEFIDEKVKLGEALTALSLEGHILGTGILPDCPLMERASMVKGILNGYLQQGEWQKVAKLLYKDTAVRALFDGDWDGLRQGIVKSAARNKENFLDGSILDLLDRGGEQNLLYNLLTSARFREESEEQIYNTISRTLSDEQKKEYFNRRAVRALQEEDLEKAFDSYEQASNMVALDGLCKQMMKDPVGNYYPLVRHATRDGKVDKKTLTKLLKGILSKGGFHRVRDYHIGENMYQLYRENDLRLGKKEERKIRELAADEMYSSPVGDSDDDALKLIWAKNETSKHPRSAYVLFRELNYDGPEVAEAVIAGLQRNRYDDMQKLKVDKVQRSDLETVYSRVTLNVKESIARHLENEGELRKLSTQFEEKGQLKRAYHLWIAGKGDLDSRYITDIREKIVRDVIEGGSDHYISTHFLDREDHPGYTQVYDLIIDRYPTHAYELARTIDDDSRIELAREGMMHRSLESAFRTFRNNKDGHGEQLALARISEKYGLSKDLLLEHIEEMWQKS